MNKDNPANQKIRAKEVLLVGKDGEKLGKMSKDKALKKAQDDGLDLVLVAKKAKPPVAKIMDYGKYQYQQKKKQKKSKKSAEMKEVRLTLNIEEHDIKVRLNQARNFLKNNHPVKISMVLRGREQAFEEKAKEKINKFINQLADISKIDRKPTKEGQNIYTTLKPN